MYQNTLDMVKIFLIETVPVVTGSTIMPAIMVTDSNWSDATKIQNSPYYRLVKNNIGSACIHVILLRVQVKLSQLKPVCHE